jgi:hypothetical protein
MAHEQMTYMTAERRTAKKPGAFWLRNLRPAPTGVPAVSLSYPGDATLEQAASDKHYLMKPPVNGKGLQYYRFTRRRKERLTFEGAQAGMTAYVCARYGKRKGEADDWGP